MRVMMICLVRTRVRRAIAASYFLCILICLNPHLHKNWDSEGTGSLFDFYFMSSHGPCTLPTLLITHHQIIATADYDIHHGGLASEATDSHTRHATIDFRLLWPEWQGNSGHSSDVELHL